MNGHDYLAAHRRVSADGAPYRPLPFDLERARGRRVRRRQRIVHAIIGLVVGWVVYGLVF